MTSSTGATTGTSSSATSASSSTSGSSTSSGGAAPATDGLAFWVRADALALSDGQSVATWPNEVDGGEAIAAIPNSGFSAYSEPTFAAGGFQGLPAVAFTAVAQSVLSVTPTLSVPNLTLITAAEQLTDAGTQLVLLGGDDGTAFGPSLNGSSYPYLLIQGQGALGNTQNCPVAPGAHIYSLTVTYDAGASLWVDGRPNCTFGPSCASNGNVLPCLGNLSFDKIGYADFQGGYNSSDGVIAEMLFYSGALSDADRATTEAYLAQKYGLTLGP